MFLSQSNKINCQTRSRSTIGDFGARLTTVVSHLGLTSSVEDSSGYYGETVKKHRYPIISLRLNADVMGFKSVFLAN